MQGINSRLKRIEEEKLISFHMPGHKYSEKFRSYFGDLYRYDITEIPGADNLHYPEEALLQTQERIQRLWNSDLSLISVNGATACIYASVFAALKPGEKVIVSRDCHKSIYTAIILRDLQPVYISPRYSLKSSLAISVSPEDVEKAFGENPDAKALIITSPTYYGVISDIEKISTITKNHEAALIIDEAHGSHLKFMDGYDSALSLGADIVVDSFHKTLPSFTQTALVHMKEGLIDKEKLRYYMRVFQTTSPSYILMASVDVASIIMEKEGKDLSDKLIENIQNFIKEASKSGRYSFLQKEEGMHGLDPSKILLRLNGKEASILDSYLRNNWAIQSEFANEKGILFMSSVMNEQSDFERLLEALEAYEFSLDEDQHSFGQTIGPDIPFKVMNPSEAVYSRQVLVEIKDATGKTSADFVIPYPPGVPLLCPGEQITEQMVEHLMLLQKLGITINGLNNSMIKVVE